MTTDSASIDAAHTRASTADRGAGASVLLTIVQLAALLLFVAVFEIEGAPFLATFALAAAGFVVHAALPAPFRLPWFALLSMASVPVVLGPAAGAMVLAIGAVLIAICHVPVRFGLRIVMVAALAAVLALLRLRHVGDGSPWTLVLPVLAAMFMFRLGLYLHAMRQEEVRFSPALSLSYFFMIPNVVFALFPVVDYRRFVESRGADDPDTRDRGIRWIVRGLLHLLLYRLVFFDLAPRELFAYGLGDVVRHVLSVVLLYLKVSGHFHVIVGMLHLFGFRLPPTHHLYFLAPSLPEFWRRINIYWKDFMAKTVYFPVFARTRGMAPRSRLLLSTLAVFVASWVLHSYQVFWIEGRPLLSWIDATFWAVFAALMLIITARAGQRPRRAPARGWSASRAAGTLATFSTVALLWSFWNAESLPSWLHLFRQARDATGRDAALLAALVAGGFAVAGHPWDVDDDPRPASSRVKAAVLRVSVILMACAAAVTNDRFGLPVQAASVMRTLQGRGQAAHHELLEMRGYYERLMARERGGAALTIETLAPGIDGEPLFVPRGDFLDGRLGRSVRARVNGQLTTTNRLGFRDGEFDVTRPPDTIRIALLGSSDVMGTGLADHETIDAFLEPQLQAGMAAGRRIEVLNLGFGGWSVTQRALAVSMVAAPLAPDLIVLSVYNFELPLLPQGITASLTRGLPITEPALARAVSAAGLTPSHSVREMIARLRPFEEEIVDGALVRAAEDARRLGVPLALVSLQLPGAPGRGALPMIERVARAHGLPMLDCAGVWEGRDRARFTLSDRDPHPNGEGARLVAECLYDRMTALPEFAALMEGGGRAPRPADR